MGGEGFFMCCYSVVYGLCSLLWAWLNGRDNGLDSEPSKIKCYRPSIRVFDGLNGFLVSGFG